MASDASSSFCGSNSYCNHPGLVLESGQPEISLAIEAFIDEMKDWLRHREHQLGIARRLFNGHKVSPIDIDPRGDYFPREWYSHFVVYLPGEGIAKGPRNPAYIGRCSCGDCFLEAA